MRTMVFSLLVVFLFVTGVAFMIHSLDFHEIGSCVMGMVMIVIAIFICMFLWHEYKQEAEELDEHIEKYWNQYEEENK